MSEIRLAGTKKVLFRFPTLLEGEFIPYVEFDRANFDSQYGFLSPGTIATTLCEYFDDDFQRFIPRTLATTSRLIKLPFLIKKGCKKSIDKDGVIDIKLSIADPEVRIKGAQSINGVYESSIVVEVEIKKSKDIEFYIDFYAKDDDDDEYVKGELKDILCGRIMIKFDYTVTTDWETILPVIPKSKFIGWKHPGVRQNCFDYALEQLRQVGYWVKSERWNKKWDGTKELNDFIFQLYLEEDVAGMKKGVQKDQFEKGVEYLKKTLKAGIPVMVGVDDGAEVTNDDLTTEHFITLVGMGEDSTGKYLLFYDNATGDSDIGTSANNRLYCKPSVFLIEGNGDYRIDYIQNTSKKRYVVTQIRETK
ncbi:MAG: hypothetical protein GX639_08705 [Fibrobacter sp.]|nr:hypothetical protein [Fibrobacter sp.]